MAIVGNIYINKSGSNMNVRLTSILGDSFTVLTNGTLSTTIESGTTLNSGSGGYGNANVDIYRIGGRYIPPFCISFIGSTYVDLYYYDGSSYVYERASISGSAGEYGTIDIYDEIAPTGLSSLIVSGDNLASATYNNNQYNTFPATIPLDASVGTIQVNGAIRNVTMNNTQNVKSVAIGDTTYTNFPVTVQANTDIALNISGKDVPIITVDYTNTAEPVITNT